MSSLNEKASAERIHIGFFGLRNAGKSSLVNAITNQKLSLVSDVKGTTTDPVKKAMELLPLGPVVIVDTPGIDDEGELGKQRVERAKQMLNLTDIAVLVVDATKGISDLDNQLIDSFKQKNIPYIIAFNKSDLVNGNPSFDNAIPVSSISGEGVEEIKNRLATIAKTSKSQKPLVSDLVSSGDTVILVVPIDESAPKGRLILPQQQTIRELLESGVTTLAVRDTELENAVNSLKSPPKLVITDSQVFGRVSKILDKNIPLTSFSILFARYKGDLKTAVLGAKAIESLKDGDTLLISEGCTHHRQCGDIGSVKLPMWLEKYTGKKLNFEFTSGGEFPTDLSKYSLVIHCGGCMLNEREMKSRIRTSLENNLQITNYGIAIAMMNGILKRSLEPFEDIAKLLKD